MADENTTGAAGESGAEAGAQAELPAGGDELAAARAEAEALRDQLLRVQAEAENVRRRAQRDVENAHKFALEKFTGELLPVLDSLEKAVEIARKPDLGDVAAIAEGVELSLRMFLGVMAKAGIEQVNPLGEPFDPQRHEAMAMVPNPHAEPNSVMDVMQKGYLLNGRLVRAAMVVVSKAPG
ncbi:MAG: nucleotide exchange factor GrpE [Pseudomonadales bacterium]|nr:nucleotide exchange factor GrpE [Pseudomonadales bacterium]